MDTPLLIGLDLGTTSCKAAIYDLAGNKISSEETPIQTLRPRSGWAEQDPLGWLDAIKLVIESSCQAIGKDRSRIRGIGVSANGPGLLMVDKHNNPITTCQTWQDQRSAELGRRLMEKAGLGWIGLGLPETGFAAKLYWSILNQSEEVKAAQYYLGVKAFLLSFLTGNPREEPSSGPNGNTWDLTVFNELNIPLTKLPPIQPSLSSAGPIQSYLADLFQIPRDTQIIMGLNDGASACLGAGLTELGQGIISLSTNGVARTTIPSRLDGQILVNNSLFCWPYVNGMYITGGSTKCGGDSLKWFMEIAYQDILRGSDDYTLIEEEARACPIGSDGVIFLPYLLGRGTPSSTNIASGTFSNLSRQHTRAHLARAVLEGVCFTIRDIKDSFARLGLLWNNPRLTGGGGRNKLWQQIMANVINHQLTCVPSDSVLGSAIAASVTLGLHNTVVDAVSAMVKPTNTVYPEEQAAKEYQNQYSKYIIIKNAIQDIDKNNQRNVVD